MNGYMTRLHVPQVCICQVGGTQPAQRAWWPVDATAVVRIVWHNLYDCYLSPQYVHFCNKDMCYAVYNAWCGAAYSGPIAVDSTSMTA